MKSKLIPKSFELGGVKWSVVKDNSIDYTDNATGLCELYKHKISLSDKVNNVDLSSEKTEQSFYHELVHSILYTMHYTELNKDEDFVDRFGTMLHQYMKSKK